MAAPNGPDDEVDLLESGSEPSWHPAAFRRRVGVGVVLAALAVGLVLGYLAGHHAGTSASAGPATTPSASPEPEVSPALAETTQTCSAVSGRRLVLGVEIANQSGTPITLGRLAASLPLGGLRPISQAVGTCGALSPPPSSLQNRSLPAGATTWLTMTFAVLVKCPAALPVQFTVNFRQSGRRIVTELPGFPDLGSVPYPGCRRQH